MYRLFMNIKKLLLYLLFCLMISLILTLFIGTAQAQNENAFPVIAHQEEDVELLSLPFLPALSKGKTYKFETVLIKRGDAYIEMWRPSVKDSTWEIVKNFAGETIAVLLLLQQVFVFWRKRKSA